MLSLGAPQAQSRRPALVFRTALTGYMSVSSAQVALSEFVQTIALHVAKLIATETLETGWLAW